MLFIIVLALTTFGIAASAAFFSVIGLTQTYSAIATYMLVAGAALELGKLVTASALYRMWDKFGVALRTYLMLAVLVLMVVTSLGIFGFLTAGYQKDSVPMEQINQKLDTDKKEIDRLVARKQEIDQQIAKLPSNYVQGRQKLMSSFDAEIKSISPRIDSLQQEIADLQTKKIDTQAHIGPIMYVAKVLGREPDEAVFWFTLLIMSVFDPLAVAMTLATNIAIDNYKRAKVEQNKPATVDDSSWHDLVDDETADKAYNATVGAETSHDLPPVIILKDREELAAAMEEAIREEDAAAAEEKLTKDDIVKIVQDAIASEDLDSAKKRKEILAALRK